MTTPLPLPIRKIISAYQQGFWFKTLIIDEQVLVRFIVRDFL